MSRRHPRPRAALALAAVVLLGAGASGAAASTTPPAPPGPSPARGTGSTATATPAGPGDAASDGPDLQVVSILPAELRPGGRLVVRGRVHAGEEGLTGVRVEVRRAGSRISSVSSLERWTAAVDAEPGPTADGTAFDDPAGSARTALEVEVGDVAAGSSVPFVATLEADGTGLRDRESAAGAYGLQLLLLADGTGTGSDGDGARGDGDGDGEDAADGGRDGGPPLDDERGFLLWSPDVEVAPTRLATTLTLQGPPPTAATGLPDPAALARLTAADGRLRRLLDAAGRLEADWLVDPVLLAGLRVAADPDAAAALGPVLPDGAGTDGPEQATSTTAPDGADGSPTGSAAEPSGAAPTDGATDGATGTVTGTGSGTTYDTTADITAGITADSTADTTASSTASSTAAPSGSATSEETQGPASQDPASSAARWLDGLAGSRGDREVVLVDWADPDPARLRSADRVEDAWGTVRSAQAAALPADLAEELLDGRVRTDVLVALDGTSTADDLLTLAQGRSSVLLPEAQVPLEDPFALTFTPDAVTEVQAGAGPLTAVLPDASLSADTASALEGSPLALTRVLARLATTTLQRPNDPRLLAVALPAGLDPAPGSAAQVAEALARTGWAETVPLTTALGTPPADAARSPLPRGRDPEVEGVQDLLDAVADGRRVAAATAAPEEPVVAAALDLRAAATLSRSADAGAAAELAGRLREQTSGTVDAVQVVPGSRVTLVAAEAALPVSVVNGLDTEVSLVLEVRSRSPRLQVPQTRVPVTVEPGQRAVVDVPVVAVASGPAEVSTQLVTADGRAWGPVSAVSVTVATQAEGRVLTGIGIGVAVLFVLGAVRAFVLDRRGRELAGAGPVEP